MHCEGADGSYHGAPRPAECHLRLLAVRVDSAPEAGERPRCAVPRERALGAADADVTVPSRAECQGCGVIPVSFPLNCLLRNMCCSLVKDTVIIIYERNVTIMKYPTNTTNPTLQTLRLHVAAHTALEVERGSVEQRSLAGETGAPRIHVTEIRQQIYVVRPPQQYGDCVTWRRSRYPSPQPMSPAASCSSWRCCSGTSAAD